MPSDLRKQCSLVVVICFLFCGLPAARVRVHRQRLLSGRTFSEANSLSRIRRVHAVETRLPGNMPDELSDKELDEIAALAEASLSDHVGTRCGRRPSPAVTISFGRAADRDSPDIYVAPSYWSDETATAAKPRRPRFHRTRSTGRAASNRAPRLSGRTFPFAARRFVG